MSNTTTDFDEFFEANEPDNAIELRDLHNSVSNIDDDIYTTTAVSGKPGRYIVEGPCSGNVKLFLASEKARKAFLVYVQNKNPHPDFDLDTAVDWEHTMNNPHS